MRQRFLEIFVISNMYVLLGISRVWSDFFITSFACCKGETAMIIVMMSDGVIIPKSMKTTLYCLSTNCVDRESISRCVVRCADCNNMKRSITYLFENPSLKCNLRDSDVIKPLKMEDFKSPAETFT